MVQRTAQRCRELAIPQDAFVVLSVAAIKREHKRIDYLVEEVSRTNDAWLVVAGQTTAETDYLKRRAGMLGESMAICIVALRTAPRPLRRSGPFRDGVPE